MKRTTRFALWLGGAVFALLLVGGIVVLAFVHKFYPAPPEAHLPEAHDVATAQRQDLDYFAAYFDLNRTYTPAARANAQRLLAGYRLKAGSMSSAEFDLAVARVVALADNGHSRVHPGPLSRHHNRLPCRLYRFDDGYRVIRARAACQPLLGAQVIGIDGRSIDDLAASMYAYFGGPRNHYDQFASVFFLESPELLHAAGLAAFPDRLTLRVALRDGTERDVGIAADPPDPGAPRVYSDQYLSPEPIEGEGPDWKPLLDPGVRLPLFLRAYAVPFQAEYSPQSGVYYVQFRSNADEPGYPIGDFVARVERDIVRSRPRFVVVDLRFDQGGDFTKTAALMQRLTTLSDTIEHVSVISDAWTFSAGIVSLALIKEHGGSKVTVVGSGAGDRTRLWAEGGSLVLPNSQLAIGFATGLHDYVHSCFGEPDCFWTMYFFPMHVATLEPEVTVPYTFDDYVSLRDPSLERVLALAAATNRGTPSPAP